MKPMIGLFMALLVCAIVKAEQTVVALPIQLVGNLILVEGKADHQRGWFVLDTGASALVLNSRYFKGKVNSDLTVTGISDGTTNLETKWVKFALGDLSWSRQQAAILSLEYIEKTKGVKILGLLGSHLFWRHELLLDLQNNTLQIKRVNRSADTWYAHLSALPRTVIPFRMKGGMPILNIDVEGHGLKLGLDTGAESNLLANKTFQALFNNLTPEEVAAFRGIGKKIRIVPSGYLRDVKVGSLYCRPMKTLFTDMNNINRNLSGTQLDGIVGYEFLRQFFVSINFRSRKITLWELKPHPVEIIAPGK